MKRLVLLSTAAIALPLLAEAAQPVNLHARTAGELAALCGANPKEPGGDARINYCHGFAQGVVDVELEHAGDKKPFCWPTPAPTRAATLGSFVDWVRALPAHASEGAADGLTHFLGERYPCK